MAQANGFVMASHMQVPDALAAIQSSTPAESGSPAAVKLRKAAGEFEAILFESLWKSMKETFNDQGDEDFDPTLQSFDDWGIQGMASAVGKSGGLGIKNMILKYLEPAITGGANGVHRAP